MARDIPYLDVQNLAKSFGALTLFENLSFSISEGQRVGLIAKNGTGKSTLLSIITGKESADSGSIVFKRDLRVAILEQSPIFNEEDSVLDACFNHKGDDNLILKAKQILTQLKISNLEQPVGRLSGGQQKRVALANVLITEPDLLILDEPTNHLDLRMIEWLEGYLSKGNRTLLMVTHDRFFLDRVCNVILELDNKHIHTYRGNYAYYLEKRQERIDAQRSEIEKANNLYRKELDWMRRMPQARGHKAKYRENAFYELEKIAKQKIEDRQIRLKANNVYIGSKIFECQYISKSWSDDCIVMKDFYYNFSRFEKMGIIGDNGAGKSTFVKMLLGLLHPDEGRIVVGDTVRFGYFSQEGLVVDNNKKVIEVITDVADYISYGQGKQMTASQFLQHFMFTPEQMHNYVYKLSGGERRKLYLCKVLMQNPNFLILDEPTNDLDIVTLQILEEYLQDFPGCVIVVSHDRYFMDKIVDHLLVFKGNGIVKDFPGNYTQYRDFEASQIETENKVVKEKKTKPLHDNGSVRKKMSFKEKYEYEQLETEIDSMEKELKQLEDEMCSGNLTVSQLNEKGFKIMQLRDLIETKTMRWMELSELVN